MPGYVFENLLRIQSLFIAILQIREQISRELKAAAKKSGGGLLTGDIDDTEEPPNKKAKQGKQVYGK